MFHEDFNGPNTSRNYYNSLYHRLSFWSLYYSKLTFSSVAGVTMIIRDISLIHISLSRYGNIHEMGRNWYLFFNELNKAWLFKIPRGDLTISEPVLKFMFYNIDNLPYSVQIANKQLLTQGVLTGDRNIVLPSSNALIPTIVENVD